MGSEFLIPGSIAGLATLLLKWHSVFASVMSTRLSLRQKRSKRWIALAESGRWKIATPWLVEDAFSQAHGYHLPSEDIRFALGRENTHALFGALRTCRGMVRLNVSSGTYSHWKGAKFKRLSYRVHSYIAFSVAYVPFTLLLFFGRELGPHIPAGKQWVIIGASFVWLFMNIVCASWFEAAHRVVAEMDSRFPAWLGADVPLKPHAVKKEPVFFGSP